MTTLRQLRYFVEIARCSSFSRAAEALAVAQPALSQNIAALEQEMGVKLFERHPKGVDLSPAGRRLYPRALELIGAVDTLKQDVTGDEELPSGPVRLCVAGSLAGAVVAPLLRELGERYPAIMMTITTGLSSEVQAQIEAGRADLALMPSAAEHQALQAQPLFEEQFMLFGALDAMANEPDPIPFAEVVKRPLATTDRAHDLRKILERAASAIDQALDIRYELNDPPMLIAIVKEGLAYAVLPSSACTAATAAGWIVGRRISDPALARVQAIVWLRDRPLAPAAMAVRDMLVRIVEGLVRDERVKGRLVGDPP